MLEELHWHFNRQIDNIQMFINSSFGYIRPDVIASLIIVMDKLIELNLTYGLFHQFIPTYMKDSPLSFIQL